MKLMREGAKLPSRGTPGSAGLDIYAIDEQTLYPDDIRGIQPGIAVKIPDGHVGILATRSSMGRQGVRIAAGANIIDADYRGELTVYLRNDGAYPWVIKPGERIAQLVIVPCLFLTPEEAETLPDSERGTGGFGSTGR